MKILLKDKNDKKINSTSQKWDYVNGIKKDLNYDELMFIIGFFTAFFSIVASAFLIKNGVSFYGILPLILIFSSGLIIYKSLYFKKVRQIHFLKKKIRLKHDRLTEANEDLEISENYQLYYNELMMMKGSNQLDKIDQFLIQNVIEEYRTKDCLNLPAFSNEERLDLFTQYEIKKSKLYQNNEQSIYIENN